MSHFIVAVIVPEDEGESKVEELLAPYDENTQVAPYPDPCWCKGRKAQEFGRDMFQDMFPHNFHDDVWWRKYEDFKPEEDRKEPWIYTFLRKLGHDDVVEEHKKSSFSMPRKASKIFSYFVDKIKIDTLVTEHLAKLHPDFDKPDPECEECNGTGMVTSTYNPSSKWDWYSFGGRWDGWITNRTPEDDGQGGFNFDDKFRQPDKNVVKVGDMLDNWDRYDGDGPIPFALVTPDGLWHESGKMGWFGCSSDNMDPDAWEKQVKEVYEKYRHGHVAYGVDCHI